MMQDEFEPICEPLFPADSASFRRTFVLIEIIVFTVFLIFSTLLSVPLNSMSRVLDWLALPMLTTFFSVPIGALLAGLHIYYRYKTAGTTTFYGSTVSIDCLADSPPSYYRADIAQCRWFLGSRAWATVPWNGDLVGPWPAGEALMIVFPKECPTKPQYVKNKQGKEFLSRPAERLIVAVGHSSRDRLHWEDFLFRNGIPRAEEYENLPAPVSTGFARLCITATLLFLLVVSEGLAASAKSVLMSLNVSEDIGDGAWFGVFISAISVPLFAVTGFFLLRRRNQVVKRGSPFLTGPGDLIALFTTVLGIVVVPFWFISDANWTVSSMVVSTALVFLAWSTAVVVFLLCCGDPASKDDFDHLPAEDTTVDDFPQYSDHFDRSAY